MRRAYDKWALAVAVMIALGGCGLLASGHQPAPAVTNHVASSAPSPVVASTPSPSASPTAQPPAAVTLTIRGQFQEARDYCIPASSVISLSTFGISVSQHTLAVKMHTQAPFGTHGNDAVSALNDYVLPDYTVTNVMDVGDPTTLMKRVMYDVGVLGRAPDIAVWWERLPWNDGLGGHFGHVVVAYGYDTTARTIEVWDPWVATGGRHTLSVTALAQATQPWGMYFYSKP